MVNFKAVAKGVSWSAMATVVKAIAQLAIFIILARYLSLTELGLIAFITLLVSISQLLSDAGISNALIFYENLSLHLKKQLYIVGLALIAIVTLIVVSVLPLLGDFFNLHALEEHQTLIAVILLLRGMSAQPLALLQKQLMFKKIALIEVVASVISLLVLLYVMWLELGVQGALLVHFTNALLIAIYCTYSCRSELGFALPRYRELSEPLHYGLYQSAEAVISFFSRQLDQLVITKVMGAEVLGAYAYLKELIAKPALQFINPVVNRVAFPSLVKLDKASRAVLYLKIMFAVSLIHVPLYTGLFWYIEPTIYVVFGSDWLKYSEVAAIIAITMLMTALINPCGPLLQAAGAVKRSFVWNTAITLARVAVVVITASEGLYTLVLGLALLQSVVFALHWFILVEPYIDKKVTSFFISLLPALFVTLVSLTLLSALGEYLKLSSALSLFSYVLVVTICIAILLFLLKSKKINVFNET
ncbi:oligosaccharide flippase family protein [Pseudoalteromonas sp. T1lg65]|uniref:oligosaccharide flippase family protein n=1 Tax=Pseudoalteromonas sp. T1lg65 TaxID=2077101 RepID=UPI003F79CB03